MGSKGTQQTIQQYRPDPMAYAGLSDALSRAQSAANLPYTPYGGVGVVDPNAGMQQGISQVGQYSQSAQPYFAQARDYITGAAAPLTTTDINRYQDPYLQNVVGATQAQFNLANAQTLNQIAGNAAARGALGGNRPDFAKAAALGQLQLSQAPTMANLYSQSYSQAINQANQEKARQQQAAYQFGNLGQYVQGAGISGGQAVTQANQNLWNIAQMQEAFRQQQFKEQQAFPYQQAQYLAGITGALAPGFGGTQTTQAPQPSWFNQFAGAVGAGIGAAGKAGAFAARGGRINGYQDGGDVEGYIPDVPLNQIQEHRFSNSPQPQNAAGSNLLSGLSGLGSIGKLFGSGAGAAGAGGGEAATAAGEALAGGGGEAAAGIGETAMEFLPLLLVSRGGRVGMQEGGVPPSGVPSMPYGATAGAGPYGGGVAGYIPATANMPRLATPKFSAVPQQPTTGAQDIWTNAAKLAGGYFGKKDKTTDDAVVPIGTTGGDDTEQTEAAGGVVIPSGILRGYDDGGVVGTKGALPGYQAGGVPFGSRFGAAYDAPEDTFDRGEWLKGEPLAFANPEARMAEEQTLTNPLLAQGRSFLDQRTKEGIPGIGSPWETTPEGLQYNWENRGKRTPLPGPRYPDQGPDTVLAGRTRSIAEDPDLPPPITGRAGLPGTALGYAPQAPVTYRGSEGQDILAGGDTEQPKKKNWLAAESPVWDMLIGAGAGLASKPGLQGLAPGIQAGAQAYQTAEEKRKQLELNTRKLNEQVQHWKESIRVAEERIGQENWKQAAFTPDGRNVIWVNTRTGEHKTIPLGASPQLGTTGPQAQRLEPREGEGVLPYNAQLTSAGPFDYTQGAPTIEKGHDVPEPSVLALPGKSVLSVQTAANKYLQTGELPPFSRSSGQQAIMGNNYRTAVENYGNALAAASGLTPAELVRIQRASKQTFSWIRSADGNQTVAIGTAVAHLNTMKDLVEAWDEKTGKWKDIPAARRVAAVFAREFGSEIPTNIDAAAAIVGPELLKAVGVAGGGALRDRLEQQLRYSAGRGSAQLLGTINTAKELMAGRLERKEDQARELAVDKDQFRRLIGAEAYEELTKLRSKKATPAGTQAPAGTQTAPAIPPANKREIGKTYTFPDGRTGIWREGGWEVQ